MPSAGSTGLGVALYLVGVFLFALNDALGKWLVADYGVGQLMLLRAIGAALVLVPMLKTLHVGLAGADEPRLYVLRVLLPTRSRSSPRPALCRSPT